MIASTWSTQRFQQSTPHASSSNAIQSPSHGEGEHLDEVDFCEVLLSHDLPLGGGGISELIGRVDPHPGSDEEGHPRERAHRLLQPGRIHGDEETRSGTEQRSQL